MKGGYDGGAAGMDEVRALLPAHALGATDAAEAAQVRALLASGDATARAAQAELADYAALREALLYSAPPARAPGAVAARLRAATRAPAAAPAPARPRRWFGLGGARLAWGAAAAATVLLLATNVLWGWRMSQENAQQAALAAQLAGQTEAVALLMDEETEAMPLPPMEEGDPAHAMVYWNPTRPVAMLYAEQFPPLPEDKVYQLWLVRGEERMNGGYFTVDEAGEGVLLVHLPMPFKDFDTLGVTPEPMGGSPGPTAPPVVRGTL
jgi:anti-sigma-K factor RskA